MPHGARKAFSLRLEYACICSALLHKASAASDYDLLLQKLHSGCSSVAWCHLLPLHTPALIWVHPPILGCCGSAISVWDHLG